MNKKATSQKKSEEVTSIKLPRAKRQKTVHSTFRLSSEAHSAINELGSVYGKHADIFDGFEELMANNFEAIKVRIDIYERLRKMPTHEVPQNLAPEIFASQICLKPFVEKLSKTKKSDKIRKTYVLREKTVEVLKKYRNEFEKTNFKITRDALIEILALTFKEELDEKKTETTALYKSYLDEIESIRNELESLESKTVGELGCYDPFDLIGKLRYEADGLMNLHQDLELFLEEEMKK